MSLATDWADVIVSQAAELEESPELGRDDWPNGTVTLTNGSRSVHLSTRLNGQGVEDWVYSWTGTDQPPVDADRTDVTAAAAAVLNWLVGQ